MPNVAEQTAANIGTRDSCDARAFPVLRDTLYLPTQFKCFFLLLLKDTPSFKRNALLAKAGGALSFFLPNLRFTGFTGIIADIFE
jgi:hypothetical protein